MERRGPSESKFSGQAVRKHVLGGVGGLREEMSREPVRLAKSLQKDAERIDLLPQLFAGENTVKYDPVTGEIFISQWRSAPESNSAEIDSDNVVFQRGSSSAKVKGRLRWHRFPHIERAIRQSEHVVEENRRSSGRIATMLKVAVSADLSVLSDYRHRQVTRQNKDEIIDSWLPQFETAGLTRVIKPNRKEAVSQTLKALGPDSLGRVLNRLINETRASSALRKLARELIEVQLAEEKYERLNRRLDAERDQERSSIQVALNLLSPLLPPELEPGEMPKKLSRDQVRQITAQSSDVCVNYLNLTTLRVAPYQRAALAAQLLIGDRKTRLIYQKVHYAFLERLDETRNANFFDLIVLESFDELANQYIDNPGAVSYQVSKRMRQTTQMLQKTLIDGELNKDPQTDTEYTQEERNRRKK